MMHHAIAKPMREDDSFRARLTSIIDMNHALVKLAKEIQWEKFEETFSPHFCEGKGRTSLPVRLMVGLMYLKHVYNLSDKGVLESGSKTLIGNISRVRSSFATSFRWTLLR